MLVNASWNPVTISLWTYLALSVLKSTYWVFHMELQLRPYAIGRPFPLSPLPFLCLFPPPPATGPLLPLLVYGVSDTLSSHLSEHRLYVSSCNASSDHPILVTYPLCWIWAVSFSPSLQSLPSVASLGFLVNCTYVWHFSASCSNNKLVLLLRRIFCLFLRNEQKQWILQNVRPDTFFLFFTLA